MCLVIFILRPKKILEHEPSVDWLITEISLRHRPSVDNIRNITHAARIYCIVKVQWYIV